MQLPQAQCMAHSLKNDVVAQHVQGCGVGLRRGRLGAREGQSTETGVRRGTQINVGFSEKES
jgi:hypothetical protein